MRIITLSLLLCGLVIQSFGVRPPLKGYTYASEQAPTGKEWQSPENLALNKEQPHAWFFPFQDIKSARKVLPPDFVNVSPKNHLQIMGRYVDVVS